MKTKTGDIISVKNHIHHARVWSALRCYVFLVVRTFNNGVLFVMGHGGTGFIITSMFKRVTALQEPK